MCVYLIVENQKIIASEITLKQKTNQKPAVCYRCNYQATVIEIVIKRLVRRYNKKQDMINNANTLQFHASLKGAYVE